MTRDLRQSACRTGLAIAAALLLGLSGCDARPAGSVDGSADGNPGRELTASPPASARYRDPQLSPAARAADLLSYMTLDEKLGQMVQVDRQFLIDDTHITTYGLGSLLSGGGSVPVPNTAEAWADMIDSYQQRALGTRLAIPLLYGTDAVHGHSNLHGATIFPHNIGLGAGDNPDLVERVAAITATEAAATGVHWNFAPMVAVPQDIRWGRTYEGFSEDVDVVARLGAAYIRGLQGELSSADTILATAKHFIGDGATDGGRDQGNASAALPAVMRDFAAPYRAAITTGVGSIMASFNSIDDVKVHGSRELLTDALRVQLGFAGLVVSDWAAIRQISASPMQQVATSVNAGIDMIMVPDDYITTLIQLKGAVVSGAISDERIDEAVLRVLETKFALGLFERPFAPRELMATIGSEAHRRVARQAVRESVVVLENEGALLPIGREPTAILLVGERADDIGSQSGGWTLSWQGARGDTIPGTTIVDAFREYALRSGGASAFEYEPGADQTTARTPDVVVAVVGEDPYAEGAGDSTSLMLPDGDLDMLRRAAALGAPLVTVIVSGRPVMINEVIELSDAVVAAWLPGSEGDGVVDVLVGRSAATGRLPYTWPQTAAALPVQSREAAAGVLFPRGFGLAYPAIEEEIP